jgi:hypothetical protein
MTIKAGERMPEGKFKTMGDKGPQDLSTAQLFEIGRASCRERVSNCV